MRLIASRPELSIAHETVAVTVAGRFCGLGLGEVKKSFRVRFRGGDSLDLALPDHRQTTDDTACQMTNRNG